MLIRLVMFAEIEVIWPVIVCRQEMFLEPYLLAAHTHSNLCEEAQYVDGETLEVCNSVA